MAPENIVKPLDCFFVPRDLKLALNEIMLNMELNADNRQLCITSRPGSPEPYREGVGTSKYPEDEFTILNERFRGTIFEKVLDLPYRFGRIRLMWMPPRSCYSLHRDTEPRIHLALVTNPQARILVDAERDQLWNIHIPANGIPHWVDTTRCHTAINGGLEPRIHLVANIIPT